MLGILGSNLGVDVIEGGLVLGLHGFHIFVVFHGGFLSGTLCGVKLGLLGSQDLVEISILEGLQFLSQLVLLGTGGLQLSLVSGKSFLLFLLLASLSLDQLQSFVLSSLLGFVGLDKLSFDDRNL